MRKFLVVFLALVLLLQTQIVLSFSDTTSHWAEEPIDRLVKIGVLNGYPDGTFKPENNVTNAELAAIIARAFKIPEKQPTKFDDVQGHWALLYIGACEGYIPTYQERQFQPDAYATREQVAVALSRCLELNKKFQVDESTLSAFTDRSEISPNLILDFSLAVKEGIINGYPDKTLRPLAYVKRAEVAKMVDFPLYHRPVRLTISPALSSVTVGSTINFHAEFLNAYGTPIEGFLGTLAWSSSNSCGELSSSGVYVAKKPGKETVSVRTGNLTASLTFEVVSPPPSLSNWPIGETARLRNGLEFTVTKSTLGFWALFGLAGIDYCFIIDVQVKNVGTQDVKISVLDFYLTDPSGKIIDPINPDDLFEVGIYSSGMLDTVFLDPREKDHFVIVFVSGFSDENPPKDLNGFKLWYHPATESSPYIVVDLSKTVIEEE